uniref:Cytochrome p450 n=2 Tax=Moniliophthora roreri TaxID=221103 RepID=A0A0W0EXB6_MONRR
MSHSKTAQIKSDDAGYSCLKAHREHAILPASLPFIGKRRSEILSSIRANIRGATVSAKLYLEAYTNYSLKEKISIVPTWTKGPQVIIPPSMTNWLAHQPSHILNAKDCTFESQQFAWTLQHPEIQHNDLMDLMIKRDLAKSVGQLNDQIVDEINAVMDELFGNDTEEWKEFGIWDSMIKVVARSANRVFAADLCRNEEYLMSCVHWTQDIQVSAAVLHMIPKFMKPYLARFITYRNRQDTKMFMKHALPVVTQRIENMTRKLNDKTFEYEAPNELLTWMIQESFKRTTESETSAESLAYRLLLLNYPAISTSTIAATNAILDVISTPPSEGVLASLTEEATRVCEEHSGDWNRHAVNQLIRIDSTLRESSRYSGIGGTGLARRVKPSNGLSLPDGTWLPKGATIGVGQVGIHFDPANYGVTADKFDAFRFSRPKEEGTATTNEDFVTTSEKYLTFSHGVHSCPGRHFAANELKLILAHLVMNYEIQPMATRPPNTPLGDVNIPPLKATMKIRRRGGKF